MAERLTSIRDKEELRVALQEAPDADAPPSEIVGDERVVWRNYCRYYRKRMDSIAEDFKRKGVVRHRPPRSFESYCEALGRSRQKPASRATDFAQPGVSGFKRAVLPERGSSQAEGPSGLVLSSPAPGEDSDGGAPETVEETAVPESAAAVSLPAPPASSFAAMGTEKILAQIERDIDNALRVLSGRDPSLKTTLCYDAARVPMEMRPILKGYAEQYATSRWQRPVRVTFEAVFNEKPTGQ